MDIENDYFLLTFRSHSDLLKLHPRKIVAWVRLPVTLYKRNLISEIGESIGPIIKIDFQTESGRRGRFARMAISIDLHKPLVSKLVINGRVQIVEYESLLTVCFSCGTYGHVKENCPKLNLTVVPDPPIISAPTNAPHPTEKEDFRPWMVVER
ncbi:hypothetical protein V6N12_074477 [Hibiscus sabdariffa]|uniref:CCHC-type domain-containing protein n=1 Tax=Hibiscus sabdariffa TaxID=183260 RepID=A0ABR1ZM98_9ROSI